MVPRLVRGGRPGHAGAVLTPRPWWFGPPVLTAPGEDTPFDLVLLDRDGTLNARVPDGYVTRPDDLELLPGAAAAVARLTRAGMPIVLVTNQRAIARGLLDLAGLEAVHQRLHDLLALEGGRLDAIVVCPHDRDACECRKPLDGLFREVLSRAPWADPRRSVMVGDMPSDLDPADGLGMRTQQVGSSEPIDGVVARLLGGDDPWDAARDVRRGEGHVP